ncbi:MAG: glycosyltransferase family 9 protein [Armatimonadota bacterium]
MLSWFRKRPAPDGPNVVRLRPPSGFGDHLMLSAVLEGVKAEHPEVRFFLAARHPELFHRNPHVEEVLDVHKLRKRDPERVEAYIHATHRPPEARYLQVRGHLIDDIYDHVPVTMKRRPRQPRLYLTERELAYRERELERLPRPRIAIVPHGKASVHLPNKLYPGDQWAELGALLVREFPTVLHLGTQKDGPLIPGARDYRDLGYRNTAGLMTRCDLLVTHVGGLMHLAAAMRLPSVVLYGAAEHPAISGYSWNRNLYTPIECGPCWAREPCDHHSCMRRLPPSLVVEQVRAALAELSAGRPAAADPAGIVEVA